MLTAIIFILFSLIVVFDFVPMVKEFTKLGKFVYWVALLAAFTILFLYSIDIKVPGPAQPIRSVVEALFGPVN